MRNWVSTHKLREPMTLPSTQRLNLLLVLLCIAAMVMVYYLDGVLGLEPCPLCVTQRIFLLLSGLACLGALLHNPSRTGLRCYAFAAALSALAGAGFAGRHVWLQHLPADQVPACGPGLGYMLETLPLGETLKLLLRGDGQCAEVLWTLFGLSIPEQSLLLFSGLAVANVFQLVRKSKQ